MKRLLLIAALAASAVSCVEGNRAVQILEAHATTESCEPAEIVINGTLNYDVTNRYLANFTLFTPIDQDIDDPNRIDFFGNELVLNYVATTPPVTFVEEVIPVHLVVGTTGGDNSVTLDLIGDKARAKLEAAVPAFPDVMTLLVSFKIRGELSSGNAVETNEVTFPISITRAGSPCPAGEVLVEKEGACFNPGQNGQAVECETAAP
jgi:hypothetical protein